MSKIAGLSPEQLTLRKQGLGASEVAAVLGLDPYRTALDVYLEKIGEAPTFEGNRFTHWGNRLEALIADEYASLHPDVALKTSGTQIGPEPWMLATPDRVVFSGQEPPAAGDVWGLECKSRGHFATDLWGESGTDEVPHSVAVQCHWGMVVTGMRRWDVAVLLGGNDYREYTLVYDEAIALEVVARARAFWHDHVLAKVHPPFTGAESDHKFLFRTYPTHTDEMVAATPAIGETLAMLQVVRASLKKYEEEKSQLEAQVKEFIGDRLGIEGPFGKVTWKHMDAVEVSAFTRAAQRRFVVKFTNPID